MSKAILPRKPAGKPHARPNTAEERLKAMSRFRSYGAWLASLSPAERRNERRRFEAERRRGMPYPAATDADLTKLLYCVGTEWVRAFYPKARGASVMVSRPFGGESDECVMLALDLAPDAEPVAPGRATTPGGTGAAGGPPAGAHPFGATVDRDKFMALCAEASAVLRRLGERLQGTLAAIASPRHPDRTWIDHGRLLDISHAVERAGDRLAAMPFATDALALNPVEPIARRDAETGGRP